MIPRIIYVFWEGEMNVFIRACLDNIIRLNPGFDVKFLTSDSVEKKPKNYENLSVQHKSDWARIEAISKTGGVWIDMSCIVFKPFESWINFDSDTFHGFEVPWGDDKIVENWAFAAPKGCPLIEVWKAEVKKSIEMGFELYNETNDKPDSLTKYLPYLTMHQAFYVAMSKINYKNVKILKSTDEKMPFHLITQCGWESDCIIEKLRSAKNFDSIFIKLIGGHTNDLVKQGVRKMNFIEVLFRHKFSHVERTLFIRIGNNTNYYLLFLLLTLNIFLIICLRDRV